MSNWGTFRYKVVYINLHLLYRPRHPCLLFGTIHEASGDPCLIFRTPLLIGTREYAVNFITLSGTVLSKETVADTWTCVLTLSPGESRLQPFAEENNPGLFGSDHKSLSKTTR